MFQDLPRYETMRLTGLQWVAEVPGHWEINRAKTVMAALDQRSKNGDEELLTVSSRFGVIPRSSASVNMFQAESYSGHKLCWPGDLVINSLWAWGRGLGVAKDHGIVSAAYGVYRLRAKGQVLPEFLHHLVRSEPFQWELQVRSQGVWKSRLQITDDRWLDAPILLPPFDEQMAAVKYLADANLRIDKAISVKCRLIELLEEQRLVAIENLLDRNAQSSDEMHFGRTLKRIEQGKSPSASEGDLMEGQWAVLSLSAVNRGAFVRTAVKPVANEVKIPDSLELSNGDLLMTRSNARDRVGDVAIVQDVRPRTFMSDLIYRLTPVESMMSADYASLLLRSRRVRDQIESLARGSSGTMPKLSQAHIKGLRVRLPSLNVQRETVIQARRILAPLDAACAHAHREISLLQEFRTRLIADVVTGQVDVRAVAARLPGASDVEPGLSAGVYGEADEVDDDVA